MTTPISRMANSNDAEDDVSTVDGREGPLRVLAWPAFENKTGNPYTGLLYEAMEDAGYATVDDVTVVRALAGRYDVWHVHWPDDFLSDPSLFAAATYVFSELVLFAWARILGVRLVWTVHDLGPHESHHPRLERLFWSLFIPMVDGIVSLSKVARAETLRRFPVLEGVPSAVVPHGPYRSAYPDPVEKSDARASLTIRDDAQVAVFVGRVRPYKNVASLVRTFRGWTAPDARLLVAGNPMSEELSSEIRGARDDDSRIRLILRFVEEDEMPLVLGAADLVVLPYESIMHSGSALLALSFDRPVLVPAQGAMLELRDQVGREWVRTYEGDLTASELADAMEWANETARSPRAPLDDLRWSRLARQSAGLYRRVLEHHG